jgi:asparagine synthase (glutamine-hydrolysing)
MCGIAGILFADASRPVDPVVLKGMGDHLAHRGPDAEGFWSQPGIGLVHRRLSILDLEGGDQPIGNEDNSIQVVFNGEIYNFQDLRQRLEASGHQFRTRSDTEVLVHLYEENGEGLLESLRGMFAFALWDNKRRRLLLARDRLGIKPLYYYRDSEKLVFASELKAILAVPDAPCTLDATALEDYLAHGMVPGKRSIFREIKKLPAAHSLVLDWEASDPRIRRYWQLHIQPDKRVSVADWQEALRAKVQEAVRLHLIADVPVGAFLSGGLDSSVVVASSASSVPESLQTFSIGFAEESFNELPYARQVAGLFGTRHTEEIVSPDAVTLLEELSHYYDEPFADPSAIPTYLVSRLAKQHVKVVLSGDGGDEAFGGYSRYAHDLREATLRAWMPRWLRRWILRPLSSTWPKADWLPRPLRAKTVLTNLALDGGPAYGNTLTLCRQPLRRQLLAPDLASALNGHQPDALIRDSYNQAPPGDPLAGMIGADVAVLLPDDFLLKVDRASMAHGLEVRPPLLDHELLELAARIPSRWKVHKGQTKYIFKQAYQDVLPKEIVWRRKQGFEMPVDAWLRQPLRDIFESAVLAPQARVADLINQDCARKLYRAHLARAGRHGNVLWSLLILACWADRYLRPLRLQAV